VIEWVGPLVRFLHDASGCALLGLLAFSLVIDPRDDHHGSAPIDRLNAAVALTGVNLLAAAAMLAVQLATVAGTAQALTDPAAWARYALSTWFGRAWLVQQAAVLVLLAVSVGRRCSAAPKRSDFALPTGLAALAAAMSALAGHGAGAGSAQAIPIQTIHVLAAGTWFGGLPVLIVRIWRATRDSESPNAVVALGRFSLLATGAMVCLAVTGLATAWLQIGSIPRLLGTLYGELLVLKLVLLGAILMIAGRIRWQLLPHAKQSPVDQDWLRRLRFLLGLELLLAVNLIGVASLLAGTLPAIHDQVFWPLPVRFAPDVTWTSPGVKEQVVLGFAVFLAGATIWLISMRRTAAAGFCRVGAGGGRAWHCFVAADRPGQPGYIPASERCLRCNFDRQRRALVWPILQAMPRAGRGGRRSGGKEPATSAGRSDLGARPRSYHG